MLCNTIIQPHFDYASSAWYPYLKKNLKSKLQIAQNFGIETEKSNLMKIAYTENGATFEVDSEGQFIELLQTLKQRENNVKTGVFSKIKSFFVGRDKPGPLRLVCLLAENYV